MASPLDFSPRAWYRAADSGVVNGVFTATDLSDHGRHATTSKQPQRVYRPGGIYSYAWQFDGVDDFLLADADVTASQPMQTVITLAKLTGSSTTRRVWGFNALYSLFANTTQWAYYANSGSTIVNLGGNTADWTVVAVRQHDDSSATRFLTTGLPVFGSAVSFTGLSGSAPSYASTTRGTGSVSHQLVYFYSEAETAWYIDVIMVDTTVGARYGRYSNELDPRGTYTLLCDNIGGLPDETTVANLDAPAARAVRNGTAVATTWTPYNVMGAPPVLRIGSSTGVSEFWSGYIAEVQVYNDYLSVDEIQSLYYDYFVPRYFLEPTRRHRSALGRLTIGHMGM